MQRRSRELFVLADEQIDDFVPVVEDLHRDKSSQPAVAAYGEWFLTVGAGEITPVKVTAVAHQDDARRDLAGSGEKCVELLVEFLDRFKGHPMGVDLGQGIQSRDRKSDH